MLSICSCPESVRKLLSHVQQKSVTIALKQGKKKEEAPRQSYSMSPS
jgi:hypothetical protein